MQIQGLDYMSFLRARSRDLWNNKPSDRPEPRRALLMISTAELQLGHVEKELRTMPKVSEIAVLDGTYSFPENVDGAPPQAETALRKYAIAALIEAYTKDGLEALIKKIRGITSKERDGTEVKCVTDIEIWKVR